MQVLFSCRVRNEINCDCTADSFILNHLFIWFQSSLVHIFPFPRVYFWACSSMRPMRSMNPV